MRETIILLHGSATGSYSWGPIRKALAATGAPVLAPDMLGYGASPPAGDRYGVAEEVAHLERAIAAAPGPVHLVAHSLGVMFALHLRRVIGPRVTRMTLIDPVVVSVLREPSEAAAFAEMESVYVRFHAAPTPEAGMQFFIDHWNGSGAWTAIGDKARALIATLAPKILLETTATRADLTPLAQLAEAPPPTTLVIGERTLLAPRAVARQLARGFDAPTIVVPGAGHMIPLTHPSAIIEAVLGRSALASVG